MPHLKVHRYTVEPGSLQKATRVLSARLSAILLALWVGLFVLGGCGGGGAPSIPPTGVTITGYSPKLFMPNITGQTVTVTGTNFSHVIVASGGFGPINVAYLNPPGQPFAGGYGGISAPLSQAVTSTQAIVTIPPVAAGKYELVMQALGTDGTYGNVDVGPIQVVGTNSPVVTSITPNLGPTSGGTAVTITGGGFQAVDSVSFVATGPVKFIIGATHVVFNSWSSLTVTAPPGAAGQYDVIVAASTPNSGDVFTYVTPTAPAITSITPDRGSSLGGYSVTIGGIGFAGATVVKFGSVQATNFVVTANGEITATVPAGTGTVDVTVTTPSGTSPIFITDQFTYQATPIVSSVSPNSGSSLGGTPVTITGSGFTSAITVIFGGVVAPHIAIVSDTVITATSPAGYGTVDVEVQDLDAIISAPNANDKYTYTSSSLPVVTAVSPNSVQTGSTSPITITGTGFTGATAVNFLSSGQNVPDANFTVVSDTEITVVPLISFNGSYDIVVTTPNGTSVVNANDRVSFF